MLLTERKKKGIFISSIFLLFILGALISATLAADISLNVAEEISKNVADTLLLSCDGMPYLRLVDDNAFFSD